MVKLSGQWPGGHEDLVLNPHQDYLHLGNTSLERRSAYRDLFTSHMDDNTISAVRNATNGNYVLGNDRFKDEIAATLKRRVTPGKPGRPKRKGAKTA